MFFLNKKAFFFLINKSWSDLCATCPILTPLWWHRGGEGGGTTLRGHRRHRARRHRSGGVRLGRGRRGLLGRGSSQHPGGEWVRVANKTLSFIMYGWIFREFFRESDSFVTRDIFSDDNFPRISPPELRISSNKPQRTNGPESRVVTFVFAQTRAVGFDDLTQLRKTRWLL